MTIQLGARGRAVIVLALVAALGALTGVVVDRLLAQAAAPVEQGPPVRSGPGGPPGGMPRGPVQLVRLAEQLDLTAAQRAALDSIMARQRARVEELSREFQPRFRQIAEQTRTAVEDVLTPDQRRELRRLRVERSRALMEERGRQLREGRPTRRPGG